MEDTRTKRPVWFASIVVAGVLAMASFAWACTVFKGKMTVTASTAGTAIAPGTPGGSTTAVGSGIGMSLCSVSEGAYVAALGGSFSVAVEPQNCGTMTNGKLGAGLYDVNYFPNYPSFNFPAPDCMSVTATGQGVPVGSLSVNTSGVGSGGPYSLPAHAARGGRAAICLSGKPAALGGPPAASPLSPDGMAAPIYVI